MAEKNSKLNCDDYTRRLCIPADKRKEFCEQFKITEGQMYRILSTQRFDMRYSEKRALQDELRYKAWSMFGALFENVSYTRK